MAIPGSPTARPPRFPTWRTTTALLLAAVTVVAVAPAARADLEGQTRQIINNAGLRDTVVSVYLYDLDADDAVLDIDPDRPMTPASNMKLLTTAAALDALGPGYSFSTDLQLLTHNPTTPPTTATLKPGALRSNAPGSATDHNSPEQPLPDLVILGSGDPALGDAALLAQHDPPLTPDDILNLWVDAVAETGYTHFDRLVIDDRIFDQEFIHPDWPEDQLNRWYCAEVAGLNFHGNCLDILYLPAPKDGHTPTVQVYPWFPSLETTNRAVTGRSDAFWISREPTANRFTFRGQVRNARTKPLRVTVYDPPMFFAELFKHRLSQKGITVNRITRPDPDAPPRKAQTLHRLNTTLAGILDRTNQDSMNLFAEALFKRLGYELTGGPGSFETGGAAVRSFMQQKLNDRVRTAIVKPVDGSGLSRNNRITAKVLVEVLRYMNSKPETADLFRASLSHAGHNGTLARRGVGLKHAEVFAKSGYIAGVSALSGYIVFPDPTRASGQRRYAFSMIFNGFAPPITNLTLKKLQDQLLVTFDQALAPAAVASN